MKRILYILSTAALVIAAPCSLQSAERPKGGASAGGPGAGAEPAGTGTGAPGAGHKDKGADTSAKGGTVAKADEQFVEKAAQGGMAEVRLGELASQKASTPEVKELGSMMVKDHSAANKELTELAAKKGISVSTELDPKHQGTLDKLGKLTGDAF